jgi:hypothetical protein
VAGALAEVAPAVEYQWAWEPSELMVFRDTPVKLNVTVPRVKQAGCEWDFGDGDRARGCDVQHVFRGGLADAWVTLTLTDEAGRQLATEKRKLPLERLPVAPLEARDQPDETTALPAHPQGEDARRILFLGPVHGVERLEATVKAAREAIHPDLVVLTGDLLPEFSEAAFADWMGTFLTPLTAGSVPVVVMPGEADLATPLAGKVFLATTTQILFKPVLDYQDEGGYPSWFSFVFGKAYVIVVDSAAGDLSDARFRWMKKELTRAAAYPTVLVVSHLPLAAYTATDSGHVERAYKVSELLLRYRGTWLVTGHYPVFFDGRFGDVRTVSVGGATADCQPLLGEQICQGATALVMDLVGSDSPRVYGLAGAQLERVLPRSMLPARVDRYSRD